MGFFKRKLRELENNEDSINISKVTSDKASDIIKALSGETEFEPKKLIDNLIVFTNTAGGTGVSTIVSNVAYTISTMGLKVIIVDLNITCPIQHAYFGIQQELQANDLVSFLLGKSELSDSINIKTDVNLLYANNRNLTDEINCNEEMAISNFEIMLSKLREYYDVVLVDCPMRIDSMLQNVVFYKADAIYCVWDEGISSIINTERIRRNMALSGIESFTKMRVILNKRTSVHFSEYPLQKLNLELVEILPFDVDIIDNSLKGQVFCEKGSSNSRNALIWAQKIQTLTDKVLKIGGYVK